MDPSTMRLSHLLLVSFAPGVVHAKTSPNVPCKPMGSYMPTEMTKNYDMRKHNGTWYEVAFRDLYPWGPVCFCQQSIKYVNYEKGYIDDYFVFSCGPGHPIPGKQNYISPQRENVTNAATGKRHPNGVYDMYVRESDFKFITHFEWNSEAIGFEDDGGEQYKWVIEWQCGTRPGLPKGLCPLGRASDGECYFTGVQMFVRDFDFREEGLKVMTNYLRSLGPAASFVMDDFGGGTFPPYFVNNSYSDQCTYPCKHGVFNETTQMWGCPVEGPHLDLKIANPLDSPADTMVV